jgi:single-strand DNA-binding protein
MLNHIVLMGRLTKDPELRHTQAGIAVASFTLAVERDFSSREEKQTDFIDIVAWRNTGEFVSRYFTKGQLVAVSGRLQISDWTDKDGGKRKKAEVVADNVYFAESKKNRDGASGGDDSYGGYSGGNNSSGGYGKSAAAIEADFSEVDDDGELPF